MNEYLVTWEIDAWEDSPRAAAQFARDAQVRPGTWAVVFTVTNKETGEVTQVDLLDEEEEDHVTCPAPGESAAERHAAQSRASLAARVGENLAEEFTSVARTTDLNAVSVAELMAAAYQMGRDTATAPASTGKEGSPPCRA